MDSATASGVRQSVARVCVEIDLLQPLPSRIWIGNGEHSGFWQQLVPERLPQYCDHCFRQGHDRDTCFVLHPTLKLEKVDKKGDAVRTLVEGAPLVSAGKEIAQPLGGDSPVANVGASAGGGAAARQQQVSSLRESVLHLLVSAGKETT